MKLSLPLRAIAYLLLPQIAIAGPDHFYTREPDGEVAPDVGYRSEGIACYIATSSLPGTVPVYRWYLPQNGVHFYTTAEDGELAPSVGYKFERIEYYIYTDQYPGMVPFYRWFANPGHFYSTNKAEGDNAGFKDEGVLGYVFPEDVSLLDPLYRWYKPN